MDEKVSLRGRLDALLRGRTKMWAAGVLAEMSGKRLMTAYKMLIDWELGRREPDKAQQKMLAKALGIPWYKVAGKKRKKKVVKRRAMGEKEGRS